MTRWAAIVKIQLFNRWFLRGFACSVDLPHLFCQQVVDRTWRFCESLIFWWAYLGWSHYRYQCIMPRGNCVSKDLIRNPRPGATSCLFFHSLDFFLYDAFISRSTFSTAIPPSKARHGRGHYRLKNNAEWTGSHREYRRGCFWEKGVIFHCLFTG